MRQALAPIGWVCAKRGPATLHQLVVGGLETLRCLDGEVSRPMAALLVANAIQGRQHFAREARRLLDNLIDSIHRGVSEGGKVRVALQFQQIAKEECEVADRWLVGHRGLSSRPLSSAAILLRYVRRHLACGATS